MPIDPRRVKELFNAALDLPDPADRPAWLDRECGGDPELRARLDELLAAHDRPAEVLELPLVERPGQTDAPPGDAGPDPTLAATEHPAAAGGPAATDADPTASFRPAPSGPIVGTVVAGRYKVRQEIGAGGMGSVYLAEQTQPVRRQVALKLIKPGMDSRTVLARFESERQALALMDHPNIAKVLDAGATDDGRPYFVMELVKGIPLTDYCDQHRLDLPARLALFRQICSAVQHAHQKGIIHRDLKPTNILVESHDDKPVPKVIDFGLAKATSGMALTDQSLYTAFGNVTGTPLYMAPEQATFNALDVDTRADIYALGVILYELLTGSTPIRRETMKRAALDEMLRVIREVEPPTPSSRISTSEGLPSLAANRQSEPRRLCRLVRGELDWIVMKALDKDRGRRYETANGLAQDVQRYLDGEPVAAVPPSAAYRASKFLRKYKGPVAAVGLVLLVLAAGVVGTTVGLVRARAQRLRAVQAETEARLQAREAAEGRDRAVRAEADARTQRDVAIASRARADDEAATAKAINDFLLDDLLRPSTQGAFALGPQAPPDPNVTVRALLERAERRVGGRFGDRPLIEAAVREVLAQSYLALERPRWEPAIANQARSVELKAAHLGPAHPKTLEARLYLAGWYEQAGRESGPMRARAAQALDQSRDALASAPDPLPADALPQLRHLADAYLRAGRAREAIPLGRRYLGDSRIAAAGPGHPDTLNASLALSRACWAAGQVDEADRLVDAVRDEVGRAVDGTADPRQLRTLMGIAAELQTAGRPGPLVPLLARMRRRAEGLDAAGDPAAFGMWTNLGKGYESAKRPADAILAYERARDLLDGARGGHTAPKWSDRLILFQDLALLYQAAHRPADAVAAFGRYLAVARELGLNSSQGNTNLFVTAWGYRQNGRPADAIPLIREAMELNLKAEGPDSRIAAALEFQLGATYLEAGQPAEAVAALDGPIGRLKPTPENRHVLRNSHLRRAGAFERLGRPDRAADDWDRAVTLTPGPDPVRTEALSSRALNRVRAGRLDEALADAEELATHGNSAGPYNAACVYARAAGRADRPGGATAREREARRAIDLLRLAVTRGYANPAEMAADDDLDAVRDRPEFAEVLAGLGKKQPDGFPLALAQLARKLLEQGRPADRVVRDAEAALRAAPRGPEGRTTPAALAALADGLQAAGRWADAEPLRREIVELARNDPGPDSTVYADGLVLLGNNLLGQGKGDEAEPLLRACLAIRASQQPDDWRTYNVRSLIGGILLARGANAEAGPLLRSGYEGMAKRADRIPPVARNRPAEALDQLIAFGEATGLVDELRAWKAERAQLDSETPKPAAGAR